MACLEDLLRNERGIGWPFVEGGIWAYAVDVEAALQLYEKSLLVHRSILVLSYITRLLVLLWLLWRRMLDLTVDVVLFQM